MEFLEMILCRLITFSFFCYNMQKYGSVKFPDLFKYFYHVNNIVTINRAKIPETKCFK